MATREFSSLITTGGVKLPAAEESPAVAEVFEVLKEWPAHVPVDLAVLGTLIKLKAATKGLDGLASIQKAVRELIEPGASSGATDVREPDAVGEQSQITSMFCELRLSAAVDRKEQGVLLEAHQRLCTAIIEKHGGYVSHHAGDGLVAYFGYPTAIERSAEHAVEAGLALVESVPTPVVPADVRVQVRVGIASGAVTADDPIGSEPLVAGERSYLAAHLLRDAQPNAVVIEEQTRRLLGDRFELQDFDVAIRGTRKPVAAWTVTVLGADESEGDAAVVTQGPPLGMASPDIVRQAAEKAAADDTVAGVVEVDLDDLLDSDEGRQAYFEAFGADSAAAFIRSTRTKAGLTQAELAKRMGVSQSRIAELERAGSKQGATMGLLARVAEACGKKLLLTLA
jgi:class 3 adenylate cyclase/DNA-binding XRE family transcriptional regulator